MKSLFLLLSIFVCVGPAAGQVLQGQWVDEAEASIEKHRKTDLRLIVLDAQGNPASGVEVHLKQVGHDFRIGCIFDDRVVMGMDLGDPVMRVFNTLSMRPLTRWDILEPAPDDVRDLDRLDTALAAVSTAGRTILWGPLVSADPGRNPDWLARQSGADVVRSVTEHAGVVMTVFGKRIEGCDVYADALDHDLLEKVAGGSPAAIRELYQHVQFLAPNVRMGLRFRDGLSPGRDGELVQRVLDLDRQVVPFDTVTVEQRFDRTVQPRNLKRALERLATIGKPVTLAELEVAGATPVAAAINLETVLRLAFAESGIEGIMMKSVRPQQGLAKNAELLDANGDPTASGKLVQNLFGKLWLTDTTKTTDDLGNVYTRVFAGRYHLTVVMPGEGGPDARPRRVTTKVHIPKADREQVVVLQPLP